MAEKQVPNTVLSRLPVYLSYLRALPEDGPANISATAIAGALGMGQVQVRKDLAMVSQGGRPKVGYERATLIRDLSAFLGYDNTTDAVLVGAGKLGSALLGYDGFGRYGLNILAAFDLNAAPGRLQGGKPVYPMAQLAPFCRANAVLMGIIAVPGDCAQAVCRQLIDAGVKAIWNFAPIHLDVPEGILVQYENMAASLAVLSKHLSARIRGF